MKAWSSFQSWLFDYGSPATMGLFRVAIGSLSFVTLALLLVDFESWYTERGYIPQELLERWNDGFVRINLVANMSDEFALALFLLTMVAALFTAVGLFSRVSSVALFLGLVTFHHRSPDILNSGDTILRLMALYVALSPSGLAFSVDRLIAIKKGVAVGDYPLVSLWPQRLMQSQLAILYFTSTWHKSFGETWLNGTATWYVPQLDEFDRFPVPAFFDEMPMLRVFTWGTLLIQLALATLVFSKPLRKWVLLAGVVLHLGIEYRFNIPLFSFVIIACYMTHYEGDEIVAWIKKLRERFTPSQQKNAVS